MEPGTEIESGMFTIKIGDKTTRWNLQIFPNGPVVPLQRSEGWLGICLERTSRIAKENVSVCMCVFVCVCVRNYESHLSNLVTNKFAVLDGML